jgi:hypothetical protein
MKLTREFLYEKCNFPLNGHIARSGLLVIEVQPMDSPLIMPQYYLEYFLCLGI